MKDEQPIISFNYQLEEQEKTVRPAITGAPAQKSYFRIHSFPLRTNNTGPVYMTKKNGKFTALGTGKTAALNSVTGKTMEEKQPSQLPKSI